MEMCVYQTSCPSRVVSIDDGVALAMHARCRLSFPPICKQHRHNQQYLYLPAITSIHIHHDALPTLI